MDIKSFSILMIILFSITVIMAFYTIYLAYKNIKKKEFAIKSIVIISFLILLVITYMYGINKEVFPPEKSMIFLLSFSAAIQSLAGVFSVSLVNEAMKNGLYVFLMNFGSVSCTLFVFYTILAIFYKKVRCSFYLWIYKYSEVIYLYGEDQQIITFLKSVDSNSKFKTKFGGLFCKDIKKFVILKEREFNKLNFLALSMNLYITEIEIDLNTLQIKEIVKNQKKYSSTLISMKNDDKVSLILLNKFYKYISTLSKAECVKDMVKIYLPFIEDENLDLELLSSKFKQKAHFYSYQSIVAYDMIFEHPIVNGSNFKKHFVFLGFGATNRKIFKNYLPVNTIKTDTRYSIIVEPNDNRNDLDRFTSIINFNESTLDKEEYFDFPKILDVFDQIKEFKCNVFKKDFIENCLNNIINKETEYSFFISIGTDVSNVMVTQKLLQILSYQFKGTKFHIYTRIKDSKIDISNFENEKLVTVYGLYESVYTYESIVKEERTKFAKSIHEALGYGSWVNCSYYDKQSSLFAFSSLRNKLRTIELDIEKTCKSIPEDEYYKRYETSSIKGKWVELNNLEEFDRYTANTLKNSLAVYEHNRWILYQILNGYVPMSKRKLMKNLNKVNAKEKVEKEKDIIVQNAGKDLASKEHICLMNFQKLIDYAKIIECETIKLKKNGLIKDNIIRKIDYLCADYMLMDKLPSILKNTKYRIVEMLGSAK